MVLILLRAQSIAWLQLKRFSVVKVISKITLHINVQTRLTSLLNADPS